MSNDTNEITAKIVIQKSYPLEKPGKWGLSGMFKVLTDDVSDDLRINLIKMEGKPGVVKLSTADETAAPQAEEGPTHTLTGVELLKRAQRAFLDAERMLAEAVQKLDSEGDMTQSEQEGGDESVMTKFFLSFEDCDYTECDGYPHKSAESCMGCLHLAYTTGTPLKSSIPAPNLIHNTELPEPTTVTSAITSHEDCDAVACPTYPDRSAEKCAGCDLLASVTPTGEDANAPEFASWEDCDSETCDWREDKSAVNCAGCPRLAAELPEGEGDGA
jgi:hypothetical protein